MDLIDTLVELIDMRSFSNLWFWIALAVVWSSASHWILGVPIDLVYRAGRIGGQAERDLEDLEFHVLDTGHFALEEYGDEIAVEMKEFLGRVAE